MKGASESNCLKLLLLLVCAMQVAVVVGCREQSVAGDETLHKTTKTKTN